ncbi:MAG: AAA family ATPase, partial [Acidimicrobiales bacterium]
AALARHAHLSDDQRLMVERVTTSGSGVEVVVGKAGAGKTTALAAAREAFEAAGYKIAGTALSARAAAGLEEGAGIPSRTIARLLGGDRSRPTETPTPAAAPLHVLVVDEAGMVGTRDLARLLDRARTSGTKVILVGDHRQLPEIAAGGAFAALAGRLGAATLDVNRRQAQAWERAALDELRHGEVSRALAAYERQGRVHASPTMDEARRRLVADWIEERADVRSARM